MKIAFERNGIVPGLALDRYREQVKLDQPYDPPSGEIAKEEERVDIVNRLLDVLVNVERLSGVHQIPEDYESKRVLLRALLNLRPPDPMDNAFLEDINRLLWDETLKKEIVDCTLFQPVSASFNTSELKNGNRLFLWKGDITSLWADAIVNAANDRMLGCFQPMHNCIDNVIHSAAGPLLRHDCKIITDISGSREKTGDAKITRAYNLPSKYVLHTVGPVIQNEDVTEEQRNQLESCYRSCLSLASQIQNIRSIAFPCISTGVFNFPGEQASQIAVKTVDDWLGSNSHHFTHVIFNVFLKEDLEVYARLFRGPCS
jgi:O-acetyl-ADP-ribose deacetylase (regulator of RNase III)